MNKYTPQELITSRKRNELGLFDSVEYSFTEDKRINWNSLVPKEFLVINKSYENQIVEKLGKPLSEVAIDEVEDHQKLMLLGATRFLLELRGFSKLEYSRPAYGSDGAVVVECKITFIPNYETDMRETVFSGIGEATKNNASPIGKNKLNEWAYYLAATAENRALIRCVRNYLRISILGKDEAASVEAYTPQTTSVSGLSPHSMLQDILDQKKPKVTLEILKKTISGHYRDSVKSDPLEWASIKDIPPNDVFSIIGVMKKKEKTN